MFYKLLDELTAECEALMAKGVTDKADTFYGHGTKLGGRTEVSAAEVIRLAGEKATERQRRSGLAGPPQRLGSGGLGGLEGLGQVDFRNFTPSQMAAMAAERRNRDNLWCGVTMEDQLAIEAALRGDGDPAPTRGRPVLQTGRQGGGWEAGKGAAGAGRGRGGDETGSGGAFGGGAGGQRLGGKGKGREPEEEEVPLLLRRDKRKPSGDGRDHGDDDDVVEVVPQEKARDRVPSAVKKPKTEPGLVDLVRGWACAVCTLVNSGQFLQCDACGAQRVF